MTTADNIHRASCRPAHVFRLDEEPADAVGRVGEADGLSIEEILRRLPSLPVWSEGDTYDRRARLAGVRRILEWLQTHPGEGWQQRWVISGADRGVKAPWFAELVADDPRSAVTSRKRLVSSLIYLLLGRVVLPSYEFLDSYSATNLYRYARRIFRPEMFARIEARAAGMNLPDRQRENGLVVVTKLVLHTGKDVDQLTAMDLFALRTWLFRAKASGGYRATPHIAWHLLRGFADLGPHETMREALRFGQTSVPDLVDQYQITCAPIRDVLIRYLRERQPALDHVSLRQLARILVKTFWKDIELHHPGISTLRLDEETATAWKQRVMLVHNDDGSTRARKQYRDVLLRVRAFYLDIQEWATEDPSWAPWAVPSPVRKGDTDGMGKVRKQTQAAMHQRVRERLPHLSTVVEAAHRERGKQAALLAAASGTTVGESFEYDGQTFQRVEPVSYSRPRNGNTKPKQAVWTRRHDSTTMVDRTKAEDDAFWSWAVIETLRHTGVRNEELLEITHLALISYQLPDTGETVPMLQIVPSKTNEERLLLVGPELASVLASIIRRLREHNHGAIPLSARYDAYERVTGPALPHLFQRRLGWQWKVCSQPSINALLDRALALTGLRDSAGEPLRYTPHDFRRMFATEAVTGGLPVHIVARLLGHTNINTTQAYMAVFDEDLIRSYRGFLDNRRALRPEAEYREPTDQEWREFQQHFHTRKLELGECARPYSTPCKHEHACIRCPSLRLDPRARPRLIEIIANLRDRIAEAKANGWLGEVAGLAASLTAATGKLTALDRTLDHGRGLDGPVPLGLPVIGPG